MTELTVRRACAADACALADLNAHVQHLHVEHAPESFKPDSRKEAADWFRDRLKGESWPAWIAESNGAPAGYALAVLRDRQETPFCRSRRWIEIDQISVRPECRRKGIARALIERVHAEAAAHAIDDVELLVWSFNDEALAAFRKLGFSPKLLRLVRAPVPRTIPRDVRVR